MEEKVWRGLGVSGGRVTGQTWYLSEPAMDVQAEAQAQVETHYGIPPENFLKSNEDELARLERTVTLTEQNLTRLEEKVKAEQGEALAQIFGAHKLLLSDPAFIGEAQQRIQTLHLSAEQALKAVAGEAIQMLRSLEDPYFQERAVDVQDVLGQLLHNLQDSQPGSEQFPEVGNYIVLADELTPAQTIALPKERVLGFAVHKGGKTSHAAILARTYGIPALVGVSENWDELKVQKWVEIDGEEGWVRPAAEGRSSVVEAATDEGVTPLLGGLLSELILAANVGSPNDLPFAQRFHAQGVGLYRTEFLFMGQSLPTEEEQVQAYRQVIAACAPELTVIRTLDIGGDKQAPALQLPEEKNPFLGVRALRLTLRRPELFRQQLRAIWRAAEAGPTAVMFPMIATLEELRQAKEQLSLSRREVVQAGYAAGELQIGMMIEIPSAAWLAARFAAEVDFFSIGTNDLTQYMLAADRENNQLAELYQPTHPAVLGMIQRVCQAGLQAGIWTGVCGEAGGDPLLAPFFAAIGIKELSMAPGSLPKVRHSLARADLTPDEKNRLVEAVLSCSTAAEVNEVLGRIPDKL